MRINENNQQKTNFENFDLNSDKIYNNNDDMNIKKEISNMNKIMNNNSNKINNINNSNNNNLNLKDNFNNGNNNYISNLNHELDESKKTIEEQKKIINDLRNVISNKDKEIYQLRCGLNNNFQNNFELNFIIQEEQINDSIPCNSSDIFAKIEEKLYEKYPKYRETENYFLFKGRKILRFKSIFENQIQNNYPVLMVTHSEGTIVRP